MPEFSPGFSTAFAASRLIGWWETADAAAAWPDAGGPDDADLARLLASAYQQCRPKARVLDADGQTWRKLTADDETLGVPERLKQAQLQQTIAIWSFERTGGGDFIGPDGSQVRVYPMGWQVLDLLFPDEAAGVIG